MKKLKATLMSYRMCLLFHLQLIVGLHEQQKINCHCALRFTRMGDEELGFADKTRL